MGMCNGYKQTYVVGSFIYSIIFLSQTNACVLQLMSTQPKKYGVQ